MGADITQNDLAAMAERVRSANQRAHRSLALEVWGNIRENAPQDHGRLAGSFTMHGGATESRIGSAVKYAAVQDQGRGPYTIYPRNGPFLTFQINGGWVRVRQVDHPGIPATNYIGKSIEQAESRIPDFVTNALRAEGL